ncbi:MAG: hypothetical protein K0S61_3599 [Anaerocolumna sp.]|jgi:protein AbiQ|nr:hypothetical protein [Anaerocolumna sp.]
METELKLYTVDTKYINYLKEHQKNMWDNDEKGRIRPYIGVLITIDSFKYYAPLSSPKPKHSGWKDRLDFIRIEYKDELKCVINLNNIIPVHDDDIFLIDIDKEEEKYADLLNVEMIEIRKKKDIIISNARSLHVKMTKYRHEPANARLAAFCYDFLKLEEKLHEYQVMKQEKRDALAERLGQALLKETLEETGAAQDNK